MTIFSVCLIALTLVLPFIFTSYKTRRAIPFLLLVCVLHCATVFMQIAMLKDSHGDAYLYYYDLEGYLTFPFALGTWSIVYFAQFLKNTFGFTFEDMMFFFGLFGTSGIILLVLWIYQNMSGLALKMSLALCLLPGLYFWTSSIGKDALMILGIVLVLTSATNLRKKIVGFTIGSIICLIARPHVFLMLAIAIIVSHTLRNSSLSRRVAYIALGLISIPIFQYIMLSFLGIDILNLSSVSSIFSDRVSYFENSNDEGVVFISNPVTRVVYFTFNPLFYNADSLTAYAASLENAVLIAVLLRVIYTFRYIENRYKEIGLALILFCSILTIFLGYTGYNIGLALREKVMIYPALIMLFALGEQGLMLRKRAARSKSPRKAQAIPRTGPAQTKFGNSVGARRPA